MTLPRVSRSVDKTDFNLLQQRASALMRAKRVTVPGFWNRLSSFRAAAPPNADRCPVLTDDYAPVDGLLQHRILKIGVMKSLSLPCSSAFYLY